VSEVPVERCDQCGFDGEVWSDAAAVDAIAALPEHWEAALRGLPVEEARRRPLPDQWSIAEYADHVREVLFGMRFLLDSAVAEPGVDLGDPPEPAFSDQPRAVDVAATLEGIAVEASALHRRLAALPREAWGASAVVGGDERDAHWVCRHAVHDASHHLQDVARLRGLLASS
jgi:hypothetical protein